MNSETLIAAIKELLDDWRRKSEVADRYESPRGFILRDCIDDLKGILPPEEEE